VSAFRRQVRVVHPDVPGTGDADAFVAVKAAYDVLGKAERRAEYDRQAAILHRPATEPHVVPRRTPMEAAMPVHHPGLSGVPVSVWIGLVVVVFVGFIEIARHLLTRPPAPPPAPEITANAPAVTPEPPDVRRLTTYGPVPPRLAGTPNYYVVPAAGTTVLWRLDEARKVLVPQGSLPPFSAVQALKLYRQNGLVEIQVTATTTGFVAAGRLAPGNELAARNAWCTYNAGPAPADGEVLKRTGTGSGHLSLENRTAQPAVIKLRDAGGATVLTTYLAPSGHASIDGLPVGAYRAEFAIGELWSKACDRFAAGMRAQRLGGAVTIGAATALSIPPDVADGMRPTDISDEDFERN
jgi:hypothetical protein